MNLQILIIEDSNLKGIESAVTAAESACGLATRGITLRASEVIRVSSESALLTNCNRVAQKADNPRIVIVDLDLCADGLPAKTASELHNSALPPSLHVTSDADKQKAGGYLIAWHALKSRSEQQLILFGTNQAKEAPVRRRMDEMRSALEIWDKYDFLDGGLDYEPTRNGYLEDAVRKWLAAFGSARSRLFPVQAETWFTTSPDVPHRHADVKPIYEKYRRAICEYLSRALQVNELEIYRHWDRFTKSQMEKLHNYLKGCVGGCASAHVGIGQRLRWKHMPFLAVASAPGPGQWIFDDSLFEKGDRDILTADCGDHAALLDYLVGDTAGTYKGLLPQLLRQNDDPTKGALVECEPADGFCTITVVFDIHNGKDGRSSLADNFAEAKRLGRSLGHDVSDALFELHGFLLRCDGSVEIPNGRNAIILNRR